MTFPNKISSSGYRSSDAVMMTAELKLKIYQRSDLDKHTSSRDGETKLGQAIRLLDNVDAATLPDSLTRACKAGARCAIVMITEDIGPRANCGRGGAEKAPQSFLSYFLNMQANRYFEHSQILMVGEVDVDELMDKSHGNQTAETLRNLCSQLDERVAPLIRQIVLSGKQKFFATCCPGLVDQWTKRLSPPCKQRPIMATLQAL